MTTNERSKISVNVFPGSILTCSLVLLFFLIFLPLASAEDFPIRLNQYAHTAWRVEDGIFDGSPLAVAQTADGYLWIGTSSGLFRYNGQDFVKWKDSNPAAAKLGAVYSLAASRDGSLWIGGASALSHLKYGTVSLISGGEGLINAIREDDHGLTWMVRSRSHDDSGPLCEVHGSHARCHGEADGIKCKFLGSMTQDRSGTMLLGGSEFICAWKPGYSASFPTLSAPGMAGIMAIAADIEGSVLVGFPHSGSGQGLQRLSSGKLTPFKVPGLDGSTLLVTAILSDHRGGLWIGTGTQGIVHIQNRIVDRFRTTDGLSSDDVERIYEDREGNVWVATQGGLDQFHQTAIISFSMKQGLTSEDMSSVLGARDGAVFAGSNDGLQRIQGSKASGLLQQDGLPNEEVGSLADDGAGGLWMGSSDRLVKYLKGRFTIVNRPGGAPMGPVRLAADNEQTVWAFVIRKNNGALFRVPRTLVAEEVPLPAKGLRTIFADDAGAIWMAGDQGHVFHYVDGAFSMIPQAPGKPGLNQIISGGANSLWLATGSKGLYRWKDGRWGILTANDGLPCNDIDSMVEDHDGALWLDMACGFVKITRDELERWWKRPEYHPTLTTFGVTDGAKPGYSLFAPGASRSLDGRLWFANDQALQMVDPAHIEKNGIPPPVHIEQIVADRIIYPLHGAITLPALTRDIAIDYSALSLTVPKSVRFSYKLSGVDHNWQDVEGRRQAFYMNLRPGTYEFQVIACNNDGVWNLAGDRLSFTIRPAFYQTLWFKVVAVLAAFLILWLIFRMRLHAATKIVESRMSERLMERNRIARELHDTLLQGFQGLLLQLQTAIRRIPGDAPEKESALLKLDRGDEILVEGRDRVRDLRSDDTGCGPLVEMLEKAVSQLQSLDGPKIHLAVDGQQKVVRVLAAEEISMFVREALSNAVRHSRATEIRCELYFTPRALRLIVHDNGVGIPQELLQQNGSDGHWGLRGMRERTKKIDGEMIVETGTFGTRFDLRVPGGMAYQETRGRFVQRLKSLRPW